SWDNVRLTLETASPTFGVEMPTLLPWKLNVHHPPKATNLRSASHEYGIKASSASRARTAVVPTSQLSSSLSHKHLLQNDDDGEDDSKFLQLECCDSDSDSEMGHYSLNVMSNHGITATFQVPGLVTVPSDEAAHNVTVTQLELAAETSWITVPKVDARVHLRVFNSTDA
ncbi:hypothetical protein C0993_000650, partial [Termitomyces sp. T159_Od127]